MERQEFETTVDGIGPDGAWTRIQIPFDVPALFGSKGRVSVRGTLNGYPFQSSIFPNGDGTFHMMLNKALLHGAKAARGDRVRVVMERDDAPRLIEPPADFEQALQGNELAQQCWQKLAPSHRQRYVEWITGAKQAATRERRVGTAVEMLVAGKKIM